MSNAFTLGVTGDLVRELGYAEQIILSMLKHMTPEQKSAAHVELDAAGVSGAGMTRYHERRDVLSRAARVDTNS